MGNEPRKKNRKQAGKKKPQKIQRASRGGRVSDRLGKARKLSDEEIARRQANDRKVLGSEPVLIGYSGPKPGKGMQFELQRWDTGTHGWSHECYARTEADAKVQGRQRLGTFGHRWRVKQLFRRAARGHGGGGASRNSRSRDPREQRGRGSSHRTVTGYDSSVPKPPASKLEDPDRTDEELELAALVDSVCIERQIARPRGLGMMRRDALLSWIDRLSVIVEEPGDSS